MTQVDYQIRFSKESSDLRNQEHFYMIQNGSEKKILLQNYAQMYDIHLLYEKFAAKALYQSPDTLAMLLVTQAAGQLQQIRSSGSRRVAQEWRIYGK